MRLVSFTCPTSRSHLIQDPTKGGEAGESTEVAVRVRFDEDKDFEPPQGSLEIIEVTAIRSLKM